MTQSDLTGRVAHAPGVSPATSPAAPPASPPSTAATETNPPGTRATPPSRPRVVLLATGGTIAGAAASATEVSGYAIGDLGADALLAAVPQIGEIADVHAEQLFNIDSKDATPAHWATLATRTAHWLADPTVDGLVITHGTDTMEETATLLDLVLPAGKPVIMTGAMRPATALSADGPMNLYDAVQAASAPSCRGHGVLLCMGEQLHAGFGLRKQYTGRLEAFTAPDGPSGVTRPAIRLFRPPRGEGAPRLRLDWKRPLPRVDVIYAGAGTTPELAEAAVACGARALIVVLPGCGSLATSWETTLAAIVGRGIPVVRASRCGDGDVLPRASDADTGAWPSGVLSPAAARITLILALAATEIEPTLDVEAFFDRAARAFRDNTDT